MIKKIKLDNGLELILNQDKSIHRSYADLYVKAGGFDTKFYYDGKYYEQPYGIAHFLEHYLLENSMYGNIVSYFDKEYIRSDGSTGIYDTRYYIDTVHDFKDSLLKLLNTINCPIFDSKKIQGTKQPIIAEINKKNDSKYQKLYAKVFQSVFKNKVFNINLGSINDINSISINDIKLFHDAFYQPSNQILVLTGNFDDNIVDTVKEFYDDLKKEYKSLKKIDIKEPKKVVKKDLIVNSIINSNLLIISFKIDLTQLSPLEKNKLDYYMGYIYEFNFGVKSTLSNYLIDKGLTNFDIRFTYNPSYIKKYAFCSLEVDTDKMDEVLKLLFETIKNLELNEETFNKWINNQIIRLINKYENIGSITANYLDNMFSYDLEQYDDLSFVKSLNLDELKKIISKIDLTNYSIVKHIN